MNRSGGANGRAASCTATISGPSRTASAARTEAWRVAPPVTTVAGTASPSTHACAACSKPAGAATTIAAMAGEAAAAPTATASMGRSPIDRNAFGCSAPRRAPAPAARMIAAAWDSRSMRAACQTCARRADGSGGRRGSLLRESSSRVAKIIRPVVVWITLRTRTTTCDPIEEVASSTTTIVPSSR